MYGDYPREVRYPSLFVGNPGVFWVVLMEWVQVVINLQLKLDFQLKPLRLGLSPSPALSIAAQVRCLLQVFSESCSLTTFFAFEAAFTLLSASSSVLWPFASLLPSTGLLSLFE